MSKNTGRITRSTVKRLQAFPNVYKQALTSTSIIVTPSATGKGIHIRWQYPESTPDDQQIIQIGHLSATKQLERELTLHVDDEFAHLFDGSLSSIDSDSSCQDLETDAVGDPFASLFEGSLSSLSSISSDESMEDDDAEKLGRVPRTTAQMHRLPSRIIFRPDDFSEEAKLRRRMKEEQRIEETFNAQWHKMVEQRQIALRTIKKWMRTKCDTPNEKSTEEDGADHQMEIDAEGHETALTSNTVVPPSKDTKPMMARPAFSGLDSGQGRYRDSMAHRRRFGPCGTTIIENPHQTWDDTSSPPVYPQEWISRRLSRRESTEILDS